MKHSTSLTVILFVITSCNIQNSDNANHTFEKGSIEEVIQDTPEHKMTVIFYDGCEYILYKEDKDSNSSYGFMSHKGNCSNPIHQCK